MLPKADFAFRSGLGILAVLKTELVSHRKELAREEFLTVYGLGRVTASDTMAALACLTLPAFLTAPYRAAREVDVLAWLEVSVLPAALAPVVASAIKLRKPVFRPSWDPLLAVAAFGLALTGVNTRLLLLVGGLAGVLLFRSAKRGTESAQRPPADPAAS